MDLKRSESMACQSGEGLASLALGRADLAAQFNRLAEAERHYARAEQLARGAGEDQTRAAAQRGLGLVWLVRENYPRAQAALELALRSQGGDRRASALTRLLIGY